jgi:hypothetical protein
VALRYSITSDESSSTKGLIARISQREVPSPDRRAFP